MSAYVCKNVHCGFIKPKLEIDHLTVNRRISKLSLIHKMKYYPAVKEKNF